MYKFEVLCLSAYRAYRDYRASGCQVQDLGFGSNWADKFLQHCGDSKGNRGPKALNPEP